MISIVVLAVFASLWLFSTLLAYIVVFLIVGYSVRPRPPRDELVESYVVRDAIPTDRFVAELEERWDAADHAPLQ